LLSLILALPLYSNEAENNEENTQEEYEQPDYEYIQENPDEGESYEAPEENPDYIQPDYDYQPESSEDTGENR